MRTLILVALIAMVLGSLVREPASQASFEPIAAEAKVVEAAQSFADTGPTAPGKAEENLAAVVEKSPMPALPDYSGRFESIESQIGEIADAVKLVQKQATTDAAAQAFPFVPIPDNGCKCEGCPSKEEIQTMLDALEKKMDARIEKVEALVTVRTSSGTTRTTSTASNGGFDIRPGETLIEVDGIPVTPVTNYGSSYSRPAYSSQPYSAPRVYRTPTRSVFMGSGGGFVRSGGSCAGGMCSF